MRRLLAAVARRRVMWAVDRRRAVEDERLRRLLDRGKS